MVHIIDKMSEPEKSYAELQENKEKRINALSDYNRNSTCDCGRRTRSGRKLHKSKEDCIADVELVLNKRYREGFDCLGIPSYFSDDTLNSVITDWRKDLKDIGLRPGRYGVRKLYFDNRNIESPSQVLILPLSEVSFRKIND